MRPIDADALLEKIKDWIEYCSGHTDIVHGIMHDVYDSVVDDIKDAPTIDAAPVRRGEWKLSYKTTVNGDRWSIEAICSECFLEKGEVGSAEFLPETPPDIALEAVRNIAKSLDTDNFCPNCGADMRGANE